MWPWIKRWRAWAMREFWPMHRNGLQPQALHFSYEKAGLTVDEQPIPWNAEAVVVETRLRLPPFLAQHKGDFVLRLPGQPPLPAESLRREDAQNTHRLFFRFGVPPESMTAEVFYKNHPLGRVTLPVLGRDEFVRKLTLTMPTVAVQLNDETVACQTFVATQCRGVVASGVLTAATALAPVLDLGLAVEFRCEEDGTTRTVPVQLSSSQLRSRQALVTVAPVKFPRRMGTWNVTWLLQDQPLATQRLRAISKQAFLRSLRVSDTRFVVRSKDDKVTLARHLPPMPEVDRVGPCFFVSSGEVGMAGTCLLQVRAQVSGAVQAPLLVEQEVLVTDGPSPFVPGTLEAAELEQVSGFELRLQGKSLGMLPMTPAPTCKFTSEGGFQPAPSFSWTSAAEEQLNERLRKLIEGR
jgi:hypothetical protein